MQKGGKASARGRGGKSLSRPTAVTAAGTTSGSPRLPPGGGIKTPGRLSDWLPRRQGPGISCRSGGRALPRCRPPIGRGRPGAALPLAGGRVRSGAGGGCHWLESRLVVRRWVASQAESRSGTGAACGGCRSERAARCRGTATPSPPTSGRGAARGRAALTVSGGSGRWAAVGGVGGGGANGRPRAGGRRDGAPRRARGAASPGRPGRAGGCARRAGAAGGAGRPDWSRRRRGCSRPQGRAGPGREKEGGEARCPFPARIPPPALVPRGLAANPAPCGRAGPRERACRSPERWQRPRAACGSGQAGRAARARGSCGTALRCPPNSRSERGCRERLPEIAAAWVSVRLCVYVGNPSAF